MSAHPIRVFPTAHRVTALVDGEPLADGGDVLILDEAGYPPVAYFPASAVVMDRLVPSDHRSRCPFKGEAGYWHLRTRRGLIENAAWHYPTPQPRVASIAGRIAFYWEVIEQWRLDGVPVTQARALCG